MMWISSSHVAECANLLQTILNETDREINVKSNVTSGNIIATKKVLTYTDYKNSPRSFHPFFLSDLSFHPLLTGKETWVISERRTQLDDH